MASKGSRKGRKIKILPDSGATMTLCHAEVARRLGLKISKKDKDTYELVDAQGRQMEVMGTCIISVVPEGCSAPRTLKCLVTPSLEDNEILLGWADMVMWGIDQQLKELKEEVLRNFTDVFVDDLSPDDRINSEPIKLEVVAGM